MNAKIDKIENEVKEMKYELKSVSKDLKDANKKLDCVVDQTADLTEFKTSVMILLNWE